MKYLDSAMAGSLQQPCLSPKAIIVAQWVGIFAYSVTIFVIFVITLATFPGFVDSEGNINKFVEWSDGTYNNLYNAANLTWSIFAFTSALITCYAIAKIFQTVRKLSSCNAMTNVNKWSMVIHAVLVLAECFVGTIDSVPGIYQLFPYDMATVVTIVTFMVQVTICYICYTMGSSS